MRALATTPEDIHWLAVRTGFVPTPACKGVVAVDDAGRTRGVVAFDYWTESAAQAHFAVETPIAFRCLLPAAFDYLVNQAGRLMALGLIQASRKRALRMARAIGFREVYRVRDGWARGEDLVIHELRHDEWRHRKAA